MFSYVYLCLTALAIVAHASPQNREELLEKLKQIDIELQLVDTVTSNEFREGDSIFYIVNKDVLVDGKVAIPKGSSAVGTVKRQRPRLAANQRNIGMYGELDVRPWISITADCLIPRDSEILKGQIISIRMVERHIMEKRKKFDRIRTNELSKTIRIGEKESLKDFKDECWTEVSLDLPKLSNESKIQLKDSGVLDKLKNEIEKKTGPIDIRMVLDPRSIQDKVRVACRAAIQTLSIDEPKVIFEPSTREALISVWRNLQSGKVNASDLPSLINNINIIYTAGTEAVKLYHDIVRAVKTWERAKQTYVYAGNLFQARVVSISSNKSP